MQSLIFGIPLAISFALLVWLYLRWFRGGFVRISILVSLVAALILILSVRYLYIFEPPGSSLAPPKPQVIQIGNAVPAPMAKDQGNLVVAYAPSVKETGSTGSKVESVLCPQNGPVEPSNSGVSVFCGTADGKMVLLGSVGTLGEIMATEKDATKQPGVDGVISYMTVSNTNKNVDLEEMQKGYQEVNQNAGIGTIAYKVPKAMKIEEPETVSVRIFGSNADKTLSRGFSETGSSSLKVIPSMLVTLDQPDNPDSFTIQPDPVESGNRFVPDDGFTEWVWTVTPLKGGDEPKQLTIVAYMVLDTKMPDGHPLQSRISSYTAKVSVGVKPTWQRAGSWWAQNWKDVVKYLVPSGAVTAFITWLLSRRKENSTTDTKRKEPPDGETADNSDD